MHNMPTFPPTPPFIPDSGWTQATRQAQEMVAAQSGETAGQGAGLEPMPRPGPEHCRGLAATSAADQLAWEASDLCKGLRSVYSLETIGADVLDTYVLQPHIDLSYAKENMVHWMSLVNKLGKTV